MHQLITQVAALVGLLILLQQLAGEASIERTLVAAAGSGLAVYGALVLGTAVVQRVLAEAPPPAPPPPRTSPPPDDAPATPS